MVERFLGVEEVVSSSLVVPTNIKNPKASVNRGGFFRSKNFLRNVLKNHTVNYKISATRSVSSFWKGGTTHADRKFNLDDKYFRKNFAG